MERKSKIILLTISVILSTIILCFFVTGFYSIDTIRIYTQGYEEYATKDAYIRDGRLFSALIFIIIGLFDPEIQTMYIINIIIAIIILSVSVVEIYAIIKRYKNLEKTRNKAIAFMLSYTYIFNFLIVDILKYIDSFIIVTSILLFIISIKKIIIEKKNKTGFFWAILGVICYQGTIPVYVATVALVTFLGNKQINKNYFKKILPCAISIIIASIISVVIVTLVPVITDMNLTDRIQGIHIKSNLWKNWVAIVNLVFYSLYMFPTYGWIIIALSIIVISFIYGIKNKNINFGVNVLFIFMVYIASLLIIFPIQPIIVAPRVALVFGQTISGVLIYIYCTYFNQEKMNGYEKMLLIIITIYFILTIFSIFKGCYEYKLGNKLDQEFAEKMENEIVRLEEQGIEIEQVGIKYTGNGQNIQKYNKLVCDQSAYINGFYTMTLNEFYTGRVLSRVQGIPEEIEKTYFENPSEEEVQFHNEGNILYVLIDL